MSATTEGSNPNDNLHFRVYTDTTGDERNFSLKRWQYEEMLPRPYHAVPLPAGISEPKQSAIKTFRSGKIIRSKKPPRYLKRLGK